MWPVCAVDEGVGHFCGASPWQQWRVSPCMAWCGHAVYVHHVLLAGLVARGNCNSLIATGEDKCCGEEGQNKSMQALNKH